MRKSCGCFSQFTLKKIIIIVFFIFTVLIKMIQIVTPEIIKMQEVWENLVLRFFYQKHDEQDRKCTADHQDERRWGSKPNFFFLNLRVKIEVGFDNILVIKIFISILMRKQSRKSQRIFKISGEDETLAHSQNIRCSFIKLNKFSAEEWKAQRNACCGWHVFISDLF